MGETGPQIAILVFYVVPHLSSMVSSTIPAWDASVNDFGVVQDVGAGWELDICGSKVTDQGLSGF